VVYYVVYGFGDVFVFDFGEEVDVFEVDVE